MHRWPTVAACMLLAAIPACSLRKPRASAATGFSIGPPLWSPLPHGRPSFSKSARGDMVSRELVAALADARRRIPGDVWRQLSVELSVCVGKPEAVSAHHATA